MLLCSRAISLILVSFCKKFYGANACTPNLHLQCHLFLDYGPASAFWLFACERINGVLGSVSTNHHAIEAQLMRKFSRSQQAIKFVINREIKVLHSQLNVSKGSNKHDEFLY